MRIPKYILCIMSILLIGCDAINFKVEHFFGLTLNSNITSVESGSHFIEVFAENNLEMKKFGPNNPMTYSMFTETNASQITVSVFDTGFITVSIKERRFGGSDTDLCNDLKSVLASVEKIKSDHGASMNQENIENIAALKRCKFVL